MSITAIKNRILGKRHASGDLTTTSVSIAARRHDPAVATTETQRPACTIANKGASPQNVGTHLAALRSWMPMPLLMH
jgi:hypothetical protein